MYEKEREKHNFRVDRKSEMEKVISKCKQKCRSEEREKRRQMYESEKLRRRKETENEVQRGALE